MSDPAAERMSPTELRAASSLALVFAFRMLGMFMVLPVLATYGLDLEGATPALIGLAIGAYGLTQALLQIPFGALSDRIGRRPIIYVGLLIFAAGAVLAALSDSIWGVIAGRILQGAGAISAAIMALLSDLTREQFRTRAMAMIGMSIGLSFAVAMILGPVLTHAFGLSGLFWVTALMALLGIGVVAGLPQAPVSHSHRESSLAWPVMGSVLRQSELLRLDCGIMVLHGILMASFVALPLALVDQGQLPKEQHWWVYLMSLVLGFLAMIPFVIYGEQQRRMRRVLLGAVLALLVCELFFWWFADSLWSWILGMWLFFTAFNLLEASLPSLISKVAPAGAKGTAMGVYSTSQFLGAALGGILGGWLYTQGGVDWVFAGCAFLCLIWVIVVQGMAEPPYVSSWRLPLGPMQQGQESQLSERLLALDGVTDVVWVPEEAAIYLKVDTKAVDRATVERLCQGSSTV